MRTELALCTAGADDTREFAAALATTLRPGDVISLTGELGAGKTCFVQGAARALGVDQPVTSPSFLLRRDYRGDVPVLHLDIYRLESLQEVLDIGYEEAGEGERVTFIEWGDAMSPLLPADHLEVELLLPPPEAGALPGGDGIVDEVRVVHVRPRGDDWKRRLPGLAAALQRWCPSGGEC